MQQTDTPQTTLTTRRDFLKTSGRALAGAALVAPLATPRPGYAAEDSTVQIALVGCGGRGTGAALQALSTKQNVKLVAMADVFADPQFVHRQMRIDIDGVPGLRTPIRFDGKPAVASRRAPNLGENTREILAELTKISKK